MIVMILGFFRSFICCLMKYEVVNEMVYAYNQKNYPISRDPPCRISFTLATLFRSYVSKSLTVDLSRLLRGQR
jgi:hypothetical protein